MLTQSIHRKPATAVLQQGDLLAHLHQQQLSERASQPSAGEISHQLSVRDSNVDLQPAVPAAAPLTMEREIHTYVQSQPAVEQLAIRAMHVGSRPISRMASVAGRDTPDTHTLSDTQVVKKSTTAVGMPTSQPDAVAHVDSGDDTPTVAIQLFENSQLSTLSASDPASLTDSHQGQAQQSTAVQGVQPEGMSSSAVPRHQGGQPPAFSSLAADKSSAGSLGMAEMESMSHAAPSPAASADTALVPAVPKTQAAITGTVLSSPQASLAGSDIAVMSSSGPVSSAQQASPGQAKQPAAVAADTPKQAKHAALAALAARRDQTASPKLTAAKAEPLVVSVTTSTNAQSYSPIRSMSRRSSTAGSEANRAIGQHQSASANSLQASPATGSPMKGVSRQPSTAASRASSGRRSQHAASLSGTSEPDGKNEARSSQSSVPGSRASSGRRSQQADAIKAEGSRASIGKRPLQAVSLSGTVEPESMHTGVSQQSSAVGSRASSGRRSLQTDVSLPAAGKTEEGTDGSSKQHSAAEFRPSSSQGQQLTGDTESLPALSANNDNHGHVSRGSSAVKSGANSAALRRSNASSISNQPGLSPNQLGRLNSVSQRSSAAGSRGSSANRYQAADDPAPGNVPTADVLIPDNASVQSPSRQSSRAGSRRDSISNGSPEQFVRSYTALQSSSLERRLAIALSSQAAQASIAETAGHGVLESATNEPVHAALQTQQADAQPATRSSDIQSSSDHALVSEQASLAELDSNAQQAQHSTDLTASNSSLKLVLGAAAKVQQQDPSRDVSGASLSQLGKEGGAGVVRHSVVLGAPATQLLHEDHRRLFPLDYDKLKIDLQVSFASCFILKAIDTLVSVLLQATVGVPWLSLSYLQFCIHNALRIFSF